MNILVTGGAGFIGSHTAELLVGAGHDVRVLDDFSTGKQSNLAAVENEIELIQGSILDASGLDRACRNIEAILHLAAISSVEKSLQQPLETHSVNATGTLSVIEAAHASGVRRIIFSSSAAVYGDHPELPKKEGSPVEPRSPYAWHKLTGEFYGRTLKEFYELEFAALRYFNVYGPRQDPKSPYSGVLSIFAERALGGRPLIVHGSGNQTRDFIHVFDVARVNLLAMEASSPLPGIMNVGMGRETKVIDAAEMIRKAASTESVIEHGPFRPGDILRSCADPALLESTLSFKPKVQIRDGLTELVNSL